MPLTGYTNMLYLKFDTPLGEMLAFSDQSDDVHGICGLYFADQFNCPVMDNMHCAENDGVLIQAAMQIQGYFAGERQSFSMPLKVQGTPFQQQVWQAVREVGFGQTTSYLALARSLGRESAVRAVGTAIGRNPVLLLTPCHRIIGSNGSLTGFAGGIERKRHLLKLEHSKA